MWRLLITTFDEAGAGISTTIVEDVSRSGAEKLAVQLEQTPRLVVRYHDEYSSGARVEQSRYFLRHVQRLYT